MVLSIDHLYDFLSNQDSGSSMEFLSGQEEESGQPIQWEAHEFFPLWKGLGCLSVVCYVLKFCSDSEHSDVLDTLTRLDDLAAAYNAKPLLVRRFIESVLSNTGQVPEQSEDGHPKVSFPIPPVIPPIGSILDPIEHSSLMPAYENSVRIRREIANTFVNKLWPEVKQFFTFPKRNETLPGFIHFLLQILNSEPGFIPRGGPNSEYYEDFQNMFQELLRMNLNMFLFYLGDIPFQFTEMEQVKNVLTEIEHVANDVGSFVYSYCFQTRPAYACQVREDLAPLLIKFYSLMLKMEEHGVHFSELPQTTDVDQRKTSAFDTLFIVESLLEDLHQIFMTGRINAMLEEMIHQTTTIREELLASQSFLKDTNLPQDGEIQEMKIQLRTTAYEARYLMSSFLVEDIPVLYLRHRLPVITHKLQLITEGFKKIESKVLRVQENLSKEIPSKKQGITHMVVKDNFAVGSEDEMRTILDELEGGSDDLKLICIHGTPGLGKTMLAKRLYSQCLLTFDKCAWFVVSQTYQKRNVLIEILMSLRNTLSKDTLSKFDTETLILQIYYTLSTWRYLVVIDDVWDSCVWTDLKRCFPEEKHGSRILFTTRDRDTAPINSIFHTPSFLSKDQCWEILEKKVFQDEPCPPQLQDSGKRIAEKCNGLPLSVVVIAGALANMEMEKSIWDKAEGSLGTDTSDCMKVLELSYNYLPDHLKLCFLYLGVFPEDAIIPVKKLIRLWIIEGFIQKEEAKSQELVAEEYLMALVNRSLVLVAENKSIGGIKGCRIHDLLREMCLRLATEENFMSIVEFDHGSTREKDERLCVPPTAPVNLRPFSLHCRSFFGHLSEPSSCLPQMKRLKVMELTPCRPSLHYVDIFRRAPLLQLRYLVINQPVLMESILVKLVNLEFLCINNKSSDNVDASRIISKMVRLRHLHIKFAIFETDFKESKNLQSLSNIHLWDTDMYRKLRLLPRLQKLKCHCEPLLPDLRFLTDLRSLSITVTYSSNEISNYAQTIYLPTNIKKLTLSRTRLNRECMSILGSLPQLQSLKLLSDAFEGTVWITKDNEFPNLRFLKLGKLKIEQWISEREPFPQLRHLVLVSCQELQTLPVKLGANNTLKTIEMHHCSYDASISAIQVEQEQLDTGNEFQAMIFDGRWSKQQLVVKYKQKKEETLLAETRNTRSPGVQCDYCGILPIVGTENMGNNICGDCYNSRRNNPPNRGYNQNYDNLHEALTSTGGSRSASLPRNILHQMRINLMERPWVYKFMHTFLIATVLNLLGLNWVARYIALYFVVYISRM